MTFTNIRSFCTALLVSSLLTSPMIAEEKHDSDFRFGGPYLFETHLRAGAMLTGDLNGDGVADFGAIENNDGLLRLYLSNDEKDPESFNDRFTQKDILLEDQTNSAEVVDTNGDGHVDILLGSAGDILVMLQNENGELEPAKDTGIEGDLIFISDMNNDSLHDLVIEEGQTLRYWAGSEGGFDFDAEPVMIYLSANPFGLPRRSDVNGDGLVDLLYDSNNDSDVVRVLFQDEDHHYKRERLVETADYYDYEFLRHSDVDQDVLVQIHAPTRRLNFVTFEMAESEDDRFSTAERISWDPEFPVIPESAIVTDVEGDGSPEILAGIDGKAFLKLIRFEDGKYSEQIVPSLKGISKIAEIESEEGIAYLLLSEDESIMASTRWNESKQRLEFPTPVELPGTPITFEVIDDSIFVAIENDDSIYSVIFLGSPTDSSEREDTELMSLPKKQNLENLVVQDFNQDSIPDIVAFIEYRDPVIYMGVSNDTTGEVTYQELESGALLEGMMKDIKPDQVSSWSSGQDSLSIIIQDEYARFFSTSITTGEPAITIEHQITGPDPEINYTGIVKGAFQESSDTSLMLRNSQSDELELFEWNGENETFDFVYGTELPAGYSSSDQMRAVNIAGDERDELLIISDSHLHLYRTDADEVIVNTITTYETETEDGGFGVVFIPNTQTHTSFIPVLEMQDYALDFLSLGEDTVNSDYRFKVYTREMKFRRRSPLEENPEPRGLAWEDFNGDGVSDMLLMAHDRLIIYLHEER